jgi:hypothetical protein
LSFGRHIIKGDIKYIRMLTCQLCQIPIKDLKERHCDDLGRAYFFPCFHHFHETCLHTFLNHRCHSSRSRLINCPKCQQSFNLLKHRIELVAEDSGDVLVKDGFFCFN